MLNRRHIRIKVMQILYAFRGSESDDLKKYESLLNSSMEGMYDLYLLMLSLLVKINERAENHFKISQKRYLIDKDDKPNYRFIENPVLIHFRNNHKLKTELERRKVRNWELDDEYVDLLFREILKSESYRSYMNSPKTDFNTHRDFIIAIYSDIIAPNEKLHDYIEDQRISWMDDFPVVNTVLVKMLRKMSPKIHGSFGVFKLFKDEEDREFGIDLLKKTLLNLTALSQVVAEKTTNWDQERIAKLDLVMLQMAICELQKFPSIPVKVTINEYLEIAKEYSTPKSSVFINGILDNLVKEYQSKGTLNKAGRGLM